MVITGHWHQFTLMAFPVSLSMRCTKCLTLSLSLWSQCCVYSYLTPPGTSGSAKSADSEICQDRAMGQSAKCLRWTRSYQRFREGNFFHSHPPPPPQKKSLNCLSSQGHRRKNFTTPISKIEVSHSLSTVGFVFQYQIKATTRLTKRKKSCIHVRERVGSFLLLKLWFL